MSCSLITNECRHQSPAQAGDCIHQLHPILPTHAMFMISSIRTSKAICLSCLIPRPPLRSERKRKLEDPSTIPKGLACGCSIPPSVLTDLLPVLLVSIISFVFLLLCSASRLYCRTDPSSTFHGAVLKQAVFKCPDMRNASVLPNNWFFLLSTACNKQTYFFCPGPHFTKQQLQASVPLMNRRRV